MGRGHKKASDEELTKAYSKTSSVKGVAEALGMCGQSVHERLTRLGVINKKRMFSEEERELLKAEYLKYRAMGRVNELATKFGRTKQFICRQAKALGLTNQHDKSYLIKEGSDPYGRNHGKVRRERGKPKKCENCGNDSPTLRYEWANLHENYEDVSDYVRLCAGCHRNFDKGLGTIILTRFSQSYANRASAPQSEPLLFWPV